MKLLIPTLLFCLNSFAQSDIINSFRSFGSGNVNGLASLNVFYAKLDEASGTVVDSKNANNGTSADNLLYSQTGKLNTAVGVTTTGGRVDFGSPAVLNLTNKGSISAWIFPTNVSGVPLIASDIDYNLDRDGYSLGIAGSKPFFEIANGSGVNQLTVNSTLSTSTWYHIVITWDGSTISGYVNGSLVTTTAQTVNATHTNSIHFTILEGYNSTGYNHFAFFGNVDEVSVFNDALTSAQVTTLYNSGTPLPFSSFN